MVLRAAACFGTAVEVLEVAAGARPPPAWGASPAAATGAITQRLPGLDARLGTLRLLLLRQWCCSMARGRCSPRCG